MYLAYPAPDDEEQARSEEALRAHLQRVMREHPERFRLRRKPRPRPAPRRHSAGDPLRLMKKERARAGTPAVPRQPAGIAKDAGPEVVLRQALAEARANGLSMAELAERAGFSERTLRRRLKAPAEMALGEYCRLVSAARTGGGA